MEKVSKSFARGHEGLSRMIGSFFVGCLGRIIDDAKMMDCMRKLAPECSRATSAAAHGAYGCCGMPFFLFFLLLFIFFELSDRVR